MKMMIFERGTFKSEVDGENFKEKGKREEEGDLDDGWMINILNYSGFSKLKWLLFIETEF